MWKESNTQKLFASFVMEQHIGHRSYYQNLRKFLDKDTEIDVNWVEVTYENGGYFWEKISILPSHITGTLSGIFQVRQGLGRRPYDIAVFNTQVSAALAAVSVNRKPFILCSDITPIQYDNMAALYGHRTDNNPLIRRYKHRINSRRMHNAARLLPWSSWVKSSLVNDYGVDPEKIEILPPGVDLNVWKPIRSATNSRLRFLFVGGDFYRKGGEQLLDAFHALPKDSAELHLVTRTKLPPSEGIHVYTDFQPNSPGLISLFQSCDVFVLPTKAEAFGIAAVEASATGLPVIASNVGGLRDIVLDGETGFLVPAMDVRALVESMSALINDGNRRQVFGKRSREHAISHFDAQKNADRMSEILMEIDPRNE